MANFFFKQIHQKGLIYFSNVIFLTIEKAIIILSSCDRFDRFRMSHNVYHELLLQCSFISTIFKVNLASATATTAAAAAAAAIDTAAVLCHLYDAVLHAVSSLKRNTVKRSIGVTH